MKAKPELRGLIPDVPSYIPRFGEMSKINYDYKGLSWKKLRRQAKKGLGDPIKTLGLYDSPPTKEMYNDFPD